MADVSIKIAELDTVATSLSKIVEEFEQASSRADKLEDAIGDPFGRNELREAAEDFEDRWNNKRDELKDALQDIQKHVKGVVDGFQNWDSETALAFESK
ncbi:WXG100 family type VII secretion target [Nocardioides sp. NPDC023903]|uniref:WXG100 family type VII secretion target n=1 Tax=Nocardioides sp. NPDC023903 TaxID=3157195 RepID=UPI0033D36483